MAKLTINGREHIIDAEPDTPLLWALRDNADLTGTKFGCGVGLCGACTVHVDGQVTRSCVTPISQADGKSVTTIEGLSEDGESHPLQQAWVAEDVPQCGYCQSGQLMAAAAFLKDNPNPSDEDIWNNMSNLCRCGTYLRIFKAIKRAAQTRTQEA